MLRWRDVCYVVLVLAVCISTADFAKQYRGYNKWFRYDLSHHLGAEYNTIAQAINKGRGFADPFHAESGPTAWMPPVLPYFLAFLYKITDDNRGKVAKIILNLQILIVGITGLMVIAQARQLGRSWLGYIIFPLGIGIEFFELFQKTHDVWLSLMLINCIWFGIMKFWHQPPSAKKTICWGLLGGFTALCNPVLALMWAILTAWRWKPDIRALKNREANATERAKKILIAAIISILVVTPWTIRNYVAMNAWVPVKSNAMYELWQSQCLDDDGVLNDRAVFQHPWIGPNPQRREYLDLGEIQFNKAAGEAALLCISEDPLGYIKRVGNRLNAAFIYYTPAYRFDAKKKYPKIIKRSLYVLPLIALIIVLAWRRLPLKPAVKAAIWIYLLALLPYMLISYVDRYATPLVGMKMLLMLFAADTVIRMAKESRESVPTT